MYDIILVLIYKNGTIDVKVYTKMVQLYIFKIFNTIGYKVYNLIYYYYIIQMKKVKKSEYIYKWYFGRRKRTN